MTSVFWEAHQLPERRMCSKVRWQLFTSSESHSDSRQSEHCTNLVQAIRLGYFYMCSTTKLEPGDGFPHSPTFVQSQFKFAAESDAPLSPQEKKVCQFQSINCFKFPVSVLRLFLTDISPIWLHSLTTPKLLTGSCVSRPHPMRTRASLLTLHMPHCWRYICMCVADI